MKKQTTLMIFIIWVLLSLSCALTGNTGQNNSTTTTSQNPPPGQETALPTIDQTSAPTPEGSGISSGSAHIGSSLNLVIGTKDRASVYPSYHLESILMTPRLSDDKTSIVTATTKITADVQGKNVHLFYTAPGSDQAKEGYIMDGKEYRMTAGKAEELMGQIALSWAGWHLEATLPFSAAGSLASKTGTETLDGRQADVYTVDSAKIDPAVMQSFRTMGMFPLDSIKGTVWIDQQTGGTLKALVDYEMDMINGDNQKTIGAGKGHLDLAISKIGQVTVQMP